MSRKPILQIIVVDKSQSLCIFAQRRIPPAGKAAAVGRKVVDFCPETVQFFAIVVEFSLAGGRPTLVSRRAHAHLHDTPSSTMPPRQIPRPKNGKMHLRWRRNMPYIYSDTPQPESKLPLPPVPLPPLGRRAIVRRTRSVHCFTQSAAWFRAISKRLRAVSATARHRPFAQLAQTVHRPTPPGHLPTQPVLPPRAPKHGSRGRCPPLPSDSGV